MDYNAIAVGPGLGRNISESLLALEQLLELPAAYGDRCH